MAKPTGVSGFFRAETDAQGQLSGRFVQTPYSAEKSEVEAQMVVAFIASMNKLLVLSNESFFLSNPRQNKEDDFDFTVDSPTGPAYLELIEIAPLQGPYASSPHNYRPYDLAQAILNGIKSKSTESGQLI